ncbi:MAG: HAMP domain-containing histidine kinase [Deltaproteobacteria bacterium]|nr:MAG: HAMP domain-containing histidine kinase [Deltaproteobacteria bacterium]
MSRKQSIGLVLLVLIPAILLGWLGVKVSYEDRNQVKQRVLSLLEARLADTSGQVERIIQRIERRFLRQLERWDGSTEGLRRLQRNNPLVRQAFLVGSSGMLLHPAMNQALTRSERDFFRRTQPIWEGRAILLQPQQDKERQNKANLGSNTIAALAPKLRQEAKNAAPLNKATPQQSARKKLWRWNQRSWVMSQSAAQPHKKQAKPTSLPTQRSAPKPSSVQFRFKSKSLQKLNRKFQAKKAPSRGGFGKGPEKPAQSGGRTNGWGDSILDLAEGRSHGWIVWYWAEGLHLLFWKRTSGKRIIGVEVDRVVLMARLVGQLPDSNGKQLGQIALRDSRGATIYQWGSYERKDGEAALVERTLAYPLHSWKLYYVGPEREQIQGLTGRIYLDLALMIGGVVLALATLAFYLYREFSRDMRDASQRVTFVTQVSHELKTPLTNIRLYAELLENRVSEEDKRSRRHVGVIVAESQRLSRLINNILTFSRQRRHQHKVHLQTCQIDDVIARTLEQFQPTFQAKRIEVEQSLAAPQAIQADPDATEQILSNLLSNVEKYGISGKWVSVQSSQSDDGTVLIEVCDKGPGIPASLREGLFQPFVRGSDKLSDGVTGTGIGLTIARDLARMQDGDLTLLDSNEGARFLLRLPGSQNDTGEEG